MAAEYRLLAWQMTRSKNPKAPRSEWALVKTYPGDTPISIISNDIFQLKTKNVRLIEYNVRGHAECSIRLATEGVQREVNSAEEKMDRDREEYERLRGK
jgi:hypothetical protein